MKKQPEMTEKTRRRIIDAFWTLAQKERGMSKLTVGHIIKEAGMNRSTFYEYFSSLPDLLDQAENDMIGMIQDELISLLENEEQHSVIAMASSSLFSHWGDRVFLLIGKDGDINFIYKFRNEMIRMAPLIYPSLAGKENLDMIVAFICSAYVGALTYWNEQGRKENIHDLTKELQTLVSVGIEGLKLH